MFRISSKQGSDPESSYSLVLELNQLEEARLKTDNDIQVQGGVWAQKKTTQLQVNEVDNKCAEDSVAIPDSKAQTLTRIFELASDESLIDHPLCADCAGQVRRDLEVRTSEVQLEIEDYQCALLRLSNETQIALPDQTFLSDMDALDSEVQAQEQQLENLQECLQQLDLQLQDLRDSSVHLDNMENQYWVNYSRLYDNLQDQLEEKDRLSSKLQYSEDLLRYLQQTDVYNDVFQIWHEGIFGTISGLRLGQTRDEPVEWEEINAAWGQALLLLQTLSEDCKFVFQQYRLHAQGSRSFISDVSSSYQLYGPPTSKLISSSFDKAMVAFLHCMKEFEDFAQQSDIQAGKEQLFSYPFEVEGDKVGTLSIKYTLNNKQKWTKSLKYTLANLKWLLKWYKETELQASSQLQKKN
eukprot:TRINITY_DN1806_c0_g1_i5.p1 TRINITY_DN1806_c0_g1~~TRINITY_DN1806_c0_g1_i5.p1  ORF type:complete len:454 (+),score=36.59 TRINITY_DN1806_c0_g1_i5:135-1364(+)